MFSLKIVTVDHYQANPIPEIDVSYSDFRGNEIKNVPVIRIFGVTPKGQKACLHIHGIFPYISLPFDGGDENPESFMQQLCLGIDKALNVARGKNNVHIDHIYKISLVSGISFYGYHEKEQKFFRIFFYNPETRKKAVELLQMGAVMNQVMQPYEAHIPYILQFFIDFNLYGMSTIDVSKIKFRLPLSASVFPEAYNENQISDWKMGTLLGNDTMDASVERMTYCEFEGDSRAEDILNRKGNDTLDMNPGLKFIWDDERQRRQIGCEIVKLTPFPSQARDCAELTESESFYKKRLRMIIDKIPQFKDSSEEMHHPENSFANGCEGFTKHSPAGTVEIHKSLSQGKEVSKMLKPNLNSKSLTQELQKDKQSMQSQNSSMYEDKEFLDMIISMIDNQNYSPTIDVESTVINEQSGKSIEQNNYTDAEDELEMSLCVWDEDVSIGSDMISLQDTAIVFPTRHLESKLLNNKSSSVYNEQENAVKCTNDNNMLQIDIDSFIIPQIDGVHDTTSRSNAVDSVDYSRREQLPYNVTTSSSNYTSSSEAQWIQTAYTSNVSDQYNFHYGAYTSYNQPTYSSHSSDQHNTFSATDNESASASVSDSAFNNIYTRELLHSQNNSGIIRSLESNMDIGIPSCTVLSTVSTTSLTNTAINETAEPCKHSSKCTQLTSPSHIFPGQFISKSIKDQSFYKAENVGKFQTIDANVLKEDISKEMKPHKNSVYASNTSTDLPIKIAFDDVKKLEVNNVGTQVYPCRIGGLLSTKTKIKSVCNTSTQTNTNSKSFLHHEEKVNEERKSNPRTLVVQHMRRLKLSLSKNRCNQRMGYSNDKHIETNYFKKSNAHPQKNSPVVERLATDLKPYPFIHRHAPELIPKKKMETENTVVLPSVLSHHVAKGIVLPPYVKSSDLNKIGNEKVVLRRLESDVNNVVSKSKGSNYTVHCINNRVKKADHLPVLTVKFKMSEINAWKKAHKSDAQTELTKSQSVVHQIKRRKKKRVILNQKIYNDITIQKGTVNRCEEKVVSENSSFATSKIAFEHTDKILSTSHTNDDFMTKANEEIKSAPRTAKDSAVSKLLKNYLNNVKNDSCNGTQNSAFNLNTTKKETSFKNATYSSLSKLCKKNKDKLHSTSHTDIIPTNLSVAKTGRKTNSKSAGWSDFPKLPESDGSGMLPLNKHNNIKSTSILKINDGKKQIITNRMNDFVITKLAKQNNKMEKNDDNDTWDLVVGRFENEAKSINARCNVAKLSKKSTVQLSSLNQIVDKRCITHKSSSNSVKKEIDSLKTVPLKLTIKLPSLIRRPRVKKRKRRSNCGLQAFQPSSCWKSLILPEEKSSTLAKNSETRPKRPNVDYKAHAYTHLLEFDKMIELPCDKIKNSRCGVKNISELGKRCKNLEIRLERLKPEFLESINLQQKSYILHKEMKLLHNSKEKNTKLGKEAIYQCLNVYPISVDTNAYSQIHNIDSENNDYTDDNLDVMWNLSYLSPSSDERALLSPPQCWSPYNNNSDESSRESISEQIAENGCFHETVHSMVISLEEKKHNSDEELLQSESNSVKCLSPTLSNTFSAHDSEVPEKSLILPELNPDNAIPYTNSPEFNVERVDEVSQHSRYIQNTNCKNVSNAEIQNIEKDCDNPLLNLAHSPVLTASQENFSVPVCSQDCKEDFNKVLHTDYDFNRFNLSKTFAQRADDQFKPEENSSTQNATYQKLDHQNDDNCDTLLHLNYKAKPIVHKNTIYQKTNICKTDNNECKLTTSPITDKINPTNEEGTSYNSTIVSSTSNLYGKKQDDCHSNLCDSKILNSTVQNSEVGNNLSEKENVKSISSVKNIVAPNVSSLLQRNEEINLKIISEAKFSEEKSNLSSPHNEETISNEFEKVDGSDQNSIQQNNTNNILKENNQLICIQVDNRDECKLNYNETEQLHSKNLHKTENVASSLHKTNAHILNSNLSENSHTPQDCCNERQINECNNLPQDTCNAFNCTKDINDVELLQSGKNAFHNTASSNILINDDIDHKESKEKQVKLSEESVCTSSNLTNKHCDSIKTDIVLDTKSITKTYLPAGVEDRNSNTKLLNNGLATSDQLDNVKNSCCIKLHETQTDEVKKNSELNVLAQTCDSQPLSPEEKVIYDSQGNILSSNTSSQYSLCMGNHASQDEVSFENCSKILNIGNGINKSNLIESFDLTNKIQKTAECISNYGSVDKNPPEQVIQEATIYKSILNLSEDILQMKDKSSKQPDKAEVSKDMNCLAIENEHFKEENCSQFCNESCLLHNNPLETKCHSKSAVLLGPFKEVSFIFNSHSQSNSEQCADETSVLSPNLTGPDMLLEENKLMTHIPQVTSNHQTEIINVSCGLSYDESKNAVTPVKLYHSKYCKSVVPPVCTKSVLQKCLTHDLAVNTIESKDTYHTDGKFSDLSNNENFSDITQTGVINEPCTSNKGETTINYMEHDKIHNAYNSNIVGLSVTDLSEPTLVDDQHKEKKSSCLSKNNCHDTLVSPTKNYIQDLEKSTKLSSDDSSNLEKLVEDDTSDITNTCLNKTPCVSQIDNNDGNDDLNEVPCKSQTDETTSKNSGIYSFYVDNTILKVDNTTMCSDKSVQLFCQANETYFQVSKRKVFFPLKKPPTSSEILATFAEHGIPQVRYQSAYYGISSESPKPISEPCGYFQEKFTLKISELLVFDGMFQHIGLEKWQSEVRKHLNIESSPFSSFSMMDAIRNNLDLKIALAKNNSVILTPAKCPPGRNEIEQFCSGKIPSQSFKQEENIEKISSQLEYINNPENEITVDSKEEKYGLNTSMSLKQKHAFIFEATSSSNYQHSTPLTKQRTQCRKKRSNSWSENETDKVPQLLKRRRLSGDHISCSLQFNHKSEIPFSDFSPICSPLVIERNEKIQNKKRMLPLESEKLQSNKFKVLSISTPIKRMPSVRKTLLPSNANHEHLTLMSLEIHAATRKNLRPDPKYDPIKAVFYCINDFTEVSSTPKEVLGIIIVNDQKPLTQETFLDESEQNLCKTDLSRNLLLRTGIIDKNTIFVKDEESLLKKVITIVRKWNPDIICGYEISMLSWGFLIQRAAYLNLNLYVLLSRVSAENYLKENYLSTEKDYNGIGNITEMQITGRIVLNVWRLMRKEVTLNIYTFENVAYHVLHQRVPYYSFCSLTQWFSDPTNLHRRRVIDFYITRVKGTLQLLHHLDLISRTSTLARVFGIQFYEVLSRGTQFRVESMMLRSAKPLNYVPVSPSTQQRASAKAPECVPLILEPESKFYTDPVLVLDFQSLYPSIIIAYNYCYSTCLGRVSCLGQNTAFEFGCSSLTVPTLLLKTLENDINVSPNGVAYVQHHIRLGVLPQMLQDILNTRIMVKKAMKEYKDDEALYKLLDGRQLALKLIANVTYGYTGASYSGRMPCVEVADSIVGKARETLERAIKLVERTAEWDAKVVYGDTDSMFVLLKGRNKEQAFKIGQEIAEAVTAINPKPVKLKFEKVYLPCLLQTKKRYVGFMYETPDQLQPVFDAKGIETVRRDSCPAVAKVLENSLKLLFTSKNISLIKKYVQKQFQKLLSGQADIQDYIFAREYRGMSNYRANACVPALEITRRMIHLDPRAEPRVGERVPYIIVYGFPGLPLIQLVRQPHELLDDPSLKINAKYYINRVIIPPLHRVFSLIGVNVSSWYIDMPWTSDTRSRIAPQERNRGTLSQYLTVLNCPICNDVTDQGICNACKKNPQHVILILNNSIRKWERKFHHLSQICNFCTGTKYKKSDCISLDCPVLFKLYQASRDISEANYFRQLQQSLDF